MHPWPLLRTGLTALNGTTAVGLALAALARTRLRRGPGGLLVAGGYALPAPRAHCFVVGGVIFTRGPAGALLDPARTALLRHELRHVDQYAVLGPLFWPAYWLACGCSWTITGGYGAGNVFERHAGLAAGGYRERRPRSWVLGARLLVLGAGRVLRSRPRKAWSGGRPHNASGAGS